MKALTVSPGVPGSVRLDDVAEPSASSGSILVEGLAVGICATDKEIIAGAYGWAPPGRDRLVLGHESLGRVLDPGPTSGLAAGDLVVGIVRRPDPKPCPNCDSGEFDMCTNGRYTERGIKERDGYFAERWRIEPEYAVRIDPTLGLLGVLMEPASVVAKAWEHVVRVATRAFWEPRSVLVIGAGPIGLLAAMIGVQIGFDTHVLDRVTGGVKPELVRQLGATYHTGRVSDSGIRADIVFECTGVGQLVLDAMSAAAPSGVVCLTGVGVDQQGLDLPSGLAKALVLNSLVVLGSVNANRRHYRRAANRLAVADRSFLEGLITRRVSLDRWQEALAREPDDVKVVVQLAPL
ncbi:MAG TPA: glucose 1-dehydrogenase [Terriglobales bacterium]|nr:glucose 1-dehydrogenase [Terriglobales bacterium]